MDKSVLVTALVVSLAGIVALNIQHIFRFLSEHLMNALFYSIKIDDASPFYYAMQRYVKSEQSKRIKNYYYKNFWDNWVQGTDGQDKIKKNDSLFFSYGYFIVNHEGSRVFLTKINETLTNTIDPWKNIKQSIRLYGFSKESVFNLLNHIEKNYYRNTINYYFNSDGEIKLLGPVSNKRFEHIFLNDNLVQKIKLDVDRFTHAKEKYDSLGIKYKRTYLFYGPAGTGKSSLSTAIANYTHRNILSINISKDITDSTLIKLVAMRPDKAIILFEDIDCLFDNLNREKSEADKDDKNKIKITLSCILNILDGAYTPDDVIFILTTNHIDKLDDAIKRDGRADVKLEITKPNTETKERYIQYINEKTGHSIDVDLTEDMTLSTLEKNLLQ